MSQYNVILCERAVESLKNLLDSVRSTSLIGAEDARTVLVQRIKKLAANPLLQSRKAKFYSLDGDFRSVLAWNYRIYYKIEDHDVIVLDIILDKK